MDLPLNKNNPLVMHIDLNSCFATVEQQANPLLRGKPLGVAAYNSPNGCIVSPSIEAKRYGIKTGMRIREARMLCRDLIIRTPHPDKYREVHTRFLKIFRDYVPFPKPKSIDEAILDFYETERLFPDLRTVGLEIKRRMREEIGEWISCNIGIGTNRFLAKLAAGLNKPDGLDVITHKNLLDIYTLTPLLDLSGINTRYQARLNMAGIFTSLDFFNASYDTLKKKVFQSINGHYWYLRLRGWEIDAVDFKTKSYGQEYSLKTPTADRRELSQIIMKLSEKTGRRLRRSGHASLGVHVACIYTDGTYWHRGRLVGQPVYTTQEIYRKMMYVFNQQPTQKKVAKLSVSCYNLTDNSSSQLDLFDAPEPKFRKAARAVDEINDKYGEFIITPALMMGMGDIVVDRVAFGGVKELEDLYRTQTT